ncbi:MAG: nucleoside-diphosphate sugar epimerase/dehydratase, partial [Planctomycetota bacterium]
MLAHILAFTTSLLLSFLLVNNMQLRRVWLVEQYPILLLFFIIIKLGIFGIFKQYRGWWRFVSISDLSSITSASVLSTLIIITLWFFVGMNVAVVRRVLHPITNVSQAIFVLDLFITILLLAGLRMAIRLYYEEFRTVESSRLKRFLIVGAGNAGEALFREIHRMAVAQYDVIGFIDDDPIKKGINIHGIPVLGTVEELPEICKDRSIEEIAIAIPSATHTQLRRV